MKREFTYSDGKSDKFWNIEVEGEQHSVTYGRSGTAGQTQIKSFGSEEAAQSAADKLVAEKLKKGYLEAPAPQNGGASSVAAPQSAAKAPARATAKAKTASDGKAEEAPKIAPQSAVGVDWSAGQARVLALEPRDWLWATWRPRTVETRPALEAKPFDKAEALARLAKVPGKHYWSPDWEKARIAPVLGREEAHFWWAAMTLSMQYVSGGSYAALFNGEVTKHLAPRDFGGDLTREQVVKTLVKSGTALQSSNPLLIAVLLNLFEPLELVGIWLDFDAQARAQAGRNHAGLGGIETLCTAFREHILPFLPDAELASLRELLRPEIEPKNWPSDFYEPPRIAFHLAAQIGLHPELHAVVRSWKNDFYTTGEADWHDHYHRPQEIVFGLGSAGEVEAQMRRLGLRLNHAKWVRAWLAHTEFSAPDWIKESILAAMGQDYRSGAKDVADALTQTFALAQGPEIAPEMLQLLLESKAPRAARQWLDDHPGHTLRGLLPTAAGRGKLAEAAVEQLRALKKRGGEEALRAAIGEAGPTLSSEAAARLQSAVLAWNEKTYEPFSDAETPAAVKAALESDARLKTAKKSWVGAADLPPVTYGERCLSDAHVEALLRALATPKHALTRAVKSGADRASLDDFAWKLFERWLGESAPPKEKWAMLALGELGGDACALKLTPLVRAWPGEAQHGRAVAGLECLRAIGTDTALMQINGIAQKVKFKGLQAKAVEAMEGIAADRGLSRAGLEDRVVPTLDLDEQGTRIFSFGPRQFRVVLSAEMKPLVREVGEAASKPRPDLPKPTAKDDPGQAQSALSEWKLLKKQLAEAVKIQSVRLENAMVRGRRWTPDEFETLLARHPLMSNLVRLLVWEAAAGNRRATFRVTEDGTYADQKDEPFALAAGEWAHIGIAHPLHLDEAERAAWSEIFSDYEIVPPFPQLGRAIYTLEAGEASGKEITRFSRIAVPPETLNFGLEKLDWQVGGLHDHGDYYEHSKVFEAAGVTAWVQYEPGLFKGYREGWEPQKMVRCFFLPGDFQSKLYFDADPKQALPLAEMDAVAVSEVLKDLSQIAARGEEKV